MTNSIPIKEQVEKYKISDTEREKLLNFEIRELEEGMQKCVQPGSEQVKEKKDGWDPEVLKTQIAKTATFIMAGGNASRMKLPLNQSKANLTIIEGVTMLHFIIRKIKFKLRKYSLPDTPIVFMVNDFNCDSLREELEKNEYYGYDKDKIRIKVQELLPALDDNNNVILDKENKAFQLPDGNQHSTDQCKEDQDFQIKHGVKQINLLPVDNIFLNYLDETQIMTAQENDAHIVTKCFLFPNGEQSGTMCLDSQGRMVTVEYIYKDHIEQPDWQQGTLCNQMVTIDFMENVKDKKFATRKQNVHNKKQEIDGKEVAVRKLEMLAHDMMNDQALKWGKHLVSLTDRSEFFPFKNQDGPCSLQTVAEFLNEWYKCDLDTQINSFK